jgi:hypothetical protein
LRSFVGNPPQGMKNQENPTLISGLPDEISMQILAKIPRINYLNLKLVSQAWNTAILSVELYNVRKELGTTEEWLYILTKVENDKLLWYALYPLSRRWQRLPPMPNFAFEDECRKGMNPLRMWHMVGSSIKIADVIRGWLGKKDTFDRMRLCGCQKKKIVGVKQLICQLAELIVRQAS